MLNAHQKKYFMNMSIIDFSITETETNRNKQSNSYNNLKLLKEQYSYTLSPCRSHRTLNLPLHLEKGQIFEWQYNDGRDPFRS